MTGTSIKVTRILTGSSSSGRADIGGFRAGASCVSWMDAKLRPCQIKNINLGFHPRVLRKSGACLGGKEGKFNT